MTIAQMIDGAPRVEVQSDGRIGLYAVDEAATDPAERYHGFLFDRSTALASGLRLIASLQDSALADRPMFQIKAVTGAIVREAKRESYAHLSFDIEGATISGYLDRKDLAAVVAELSALLRDL